MNKYSFTYTDHLVALANINIDETLYKGILCPLRGGFYISDFVSRKYNLPIYYMDIKSYKDDLRGATQIIKADSLYEGNYLICDDIYDTGKTVEAIKQYYYNCTFDVYCLVSKQGTKDIKYDIKVPEDEWVEFWWEKV